MMTREDTQELLALISAAYPSYRPANKTYTVNLWREMLRDYDPRQVKAALKAFIATDAKGFPPAVGQIIDQMHRLAPDSDPDEMTAWAMVADACRNGIYGSREEFAKLPPTVQRAVGSAENIRAWAMADLQDFQTVIQSNFLRAYRAKKAQAKELSRIPADVRALLQGTTQKMLN